MLINKILIIRCGGYKCVRFVSKPLKKGQKHENYNIDNQ